MKRRLLKLALFVLAGAIVNVAVAWGIVLLPQAVIAYPGYRFETAETVPRWMMNGFNTASRQWVQWIPVFHDFSNAPGTDLDAALGLYVAEGAPPFWTRHDWSKSPTSESNYDVLEDARGWPLLGVSSITRVDFCDGDLRFDTIGGIALDAPSTIQVFEDLSSIRIFSIIPIFPGFAINTIFYAAILWVLFASPGAIRRRLRRWRGQCPACAYPIGASAECSECGKAIPASLLGRS